MTRRATEANDAGEGRLTNYVRYTKTDMEARCEIERIPRSSPQRITRWRVRPSA